MKTISNPERLTLVFSCNTEYCEQMIYGLLLPYLKNNIHSQPCPECKKTMQFDYMEIRE